jgi:hypothetical protein
MNGRRTARQNHPQPRQKLPTGITRDTSNLAGRRGEFQCDARSFSNGSQVGSACRRQGFGADIEPAPNWGTRFGPDGARRPAGPPPELPISVIFGGLQSRPNPARRAAPHLAMCRRFPPIWPSSWAERKRRWLGGHQPAQAETPGLMVLRPSTNSTAAGGSAKPSCGPSSCWNLANGEDPVIGVVPSRHENALHPASARGPASVICSRATSIIRPLARMRSDSAVAQSGAHQSRLQFEPEAVRQQQVDSAPWP